MFLFVRKNHTIIHIALAFADGTQLALQQGFAQRRDAVDVNMTLKMVVFVLDDT